MLTPIKLTKTTRCRSLFLVYAPTQKRLLTRPVGMTYFLLEAITRSISVIRCFTIKLGRDGLLLTQLLREYRVASLGGSFSIGIRVLHRMLPSTTLVYPLLAVYAVKISSPVNEDTYATSPALSLNRLLC